MQIFLADKNITDLHSLDETLTAFLSLDALKSDMEGFRDEIIEYYLQDENVGPGEGGEGMFTFRSVPPWGVFVNQSTCSAVVDVVFLSCVYFSWLVVYFNLNKI